MKKIAFIMILISVISLGSKAQSTEIQQLLLNAEKLTMLKSIMEDMKKGYQVLSSGYNTIKDVSQGNFNLHETFLDGLMAVSPTVKKYRKVGEIINYEILLVKEYKQAYSRFSRDPNFTPEYLTYLSKVYSNLFNLSLKNLDDLTNIVTASRLRMTDDERLKAIDKIHADMEDKLLFLRDFNSENKVLAIQWARERNDVNTIRGIYGLTN